LIKKCKIINNPSLKDFKNTLQYISPECFKVDKSMILSTNLGLFFKGKAEKNTLLCGYRGIVKSNRLENYGHYSVLLVNTRYLIDATCYRNTKSRYRNKYSDSLILLSLYTINH
jgi:hypothetical protein